MNYTNKSISKILIFDQLHLAQQEINNLRLLNVCIQSTLFRVQTQLIEYIPINNSDEIKRNQTKQKLAFIRQSNDYNRRIIDHQQISFINNFKTLFENKQDLQLKSISLLKNEKQIEILFEMFHELNTIIHTEHNDRISQLYITLTQTSHSVIKTREILDQTIHVHKKLEKKKFHRKLFFIFIIFTFILIIIFFIFISIRIH